MFELLTQFCPEVEQGIRNIYLMIPSSSSSSIDHSSAVRSNIRKEVIETELKSLRQEAQKAEKDGETAVVNKSSSFMYAQLLVEKYIDVAAMLRQKLVTEESELWLTCDASTGVLGGMSSDEDESKDVVSIMLADAQRAGSQSSSSSISARSDTSLVAGRAKEAPSKLAELCKRNKGFHYCIANALLSAQICIILSMQEFIFKGSLVALCSFDPYTQSDIEIDFTPYVAYFGSFVFVACVNCFMVILYVCRALSRRNKLSDAEDGCCYSALFKQGLFLLLDVISLLTCLVNVVSCTLFFSIDQ
jgi:hypothetical protein